LLTAALFLFPPVSPTFRRFLCAKRSLPLEGRSFGVAQTTLGLESNPTFSLANSPGSPVDSRRLLTALSNAAHQNLGCELWSFSPSSPSHATQSAGRRFETHTGRLPSASC
jgi:hypothetical protein